jgi:hypothetical protein
VFRPFDNWDHFVECRRTSLVAVYARSQRATFCERVNLIEEHYTDTHGYTELNFRRIKDVKHQQIYRIDATMDSGSLLTLWAGLTSLIPVVPDNIVSLGCSKPVASVSNNSIHQSGRIPPLRRAGANRLRGGFAQDQRRQTRQEAVERTIRRP